VLWVTWAPSSLTLNLNYRDPTGNTYASAVGPTIQSASGTAAQIVYAKSIAGGTDPIAFPFNSGSATSVSCVAVEYSGADTMYPLDSVSESISSSANGTLDSGTSAPANANLLVFGGGTSDNTNLPTVGSGFTLIQSNNGGGTTAGSITEQMIVSGNNTLQRATAGYSPSGPTGDWVMQMAVFRDASWTTANGWSAGRQHQTLYASQFPGVDASAKIQNAINECAPTGCTVSALDLTDVGGTGSTTIDPGVGRSVTILLGPTTYNFTQVMLRTDLKLIGQGAFRTMIQDANSGTNLNNPLFVIPQVTGQAVQHVELSSFQVQGASTNTSAICIDADSSSTSFSNYGFWFSYIHDITIYNFAGQGIYLAGHPNDWGAGYQFDTWSNVYIGRPGNTEGIRISGGGGQQQFINVQVQATGTPGTAVVITSPGTAFTYNDNFLLGTIQGANVGVSVAACNACVFDGMHFEGIGGVYQINSGALGTNIRGNYFAGNTGTNGGSGYIVQTNAGSAGTNVVGNTIYGTPDAFIVNSSNVTINAQGNDYNGTGTIQGQLALSSVAGDLSAIRSSTEGALYLGNDGSEIIRIGNLLNFNVGSYNTYGTENHGAIQLNNPTPSSPPSGVLALGTTTGFGNGTSGTPVTTTKLGTGTGPANPQTVVHYLQVNIGGAAYWVPLVQ